MEQQSQQAIFFIIYEEDNSTHLFLLEGFTLLLLDLHSTDNSYAQDLNIKIRKKDI